MEPNLADIFDYPSYKILAALLAPEQRELLDVLCERCFLKGQSVALADLSAMMRPTHA